MSIGSEIDALGFKGAPAVPASLCLFVQGCRNVTARGPLPLCLIQNVLKLFPFFLPPLLLPLLSRGISKQKAEPWIYTTLALPG